MNWPVAERALKLLKEYTQFGKKELGNDLNFDYVPATCMTEVTVSERKIMAVDRANDLACEFVVSAGSAYMGLQVR